jgi:hypothetical protein
MNLKDMKRKALSLIEEISPDNVNLTEDPDIAAKLNDVINQVMFEIIRLKKLPKYVEMDVKAGDLVDFAAIGAEVGYEVYQISMVGGVNYIPKADGTVLKILSDGTAEIEVYVYPEMITSSTKDSYEFDLPSDVLEIMPYGIAADLLKSDVSNEYGSIYAAEFERKLSRLDPRYSTPGYYIEGGIDI